MASLTNVLGSIPGYGGFSARNEQLQGEEQAQLGQVGKLMQLQQMMQERQSAGVEQQRNQAMMAEIAAIPPAQRNADTIRPIIMKYARKPADVMAALPVSEKAQPIGSGGLRLPTGEIVPPSAKPEVARPPVESDLARLIRERDALPAGDPNRRAFEAAIVAKGPKPEQRPKPRPDFRYRADGSDEQEVIPGSKTAIEMNRKQAQGRQGVTLATQNLDALDKALGDLVSSPGLPRITGTLMGGAPNVTNEATDAQAKLDTIKAQTFVAALQAMRQASPTGGAVGQVTEKEGDKLENSLAALGQRQSTESFKSQVQIMRDRLKASRASIRNAYKEQFGEELPDTPKAAPAQPGAPQPAAGAFSDPDKERRYQEWKRSQGR